MLNPEYTNPTGVLWWGQSGLSEALLKIRVHAFHKTDSTALELEVFLLTDMFPFPQDSADEALQRAATSGCLKML